MRWRRDTGLVPASRARPATGSTLARVSENRIVPTQAPEAQTADAYLRLSAHLLLESERRDVRTIGVVSAVPGEGKTTAAINLVACLGRARGRRTSRRATKRAPARSASRTGRPQQRNKRRGKQQQRQERGDEAN